MGDLISCSLLNEFFSLLRKKETVVIDNDLLHNLFNDDLNLLTRTVCFYEQECKLEFNKQYYNQQLISICLLSDVDELHLIQNDNPNIKFFNFIDSTNFYLFKCCSHSIIDYQVAVADFQTNGYGRNQKEFVSSFGKQLLFSFALTFDKLEDLNGLSLVIGLSIIKTLEKLGYKNLNIKWPNDIYLNKKKICGIIVETKFFNKQLVVIVGVGINVLNFDFSRISNNNVSSLEENEMRNTIINRRVLLTHIIKDIKSYMNKFKCESLLPFIDEFESKDLFANQIVQAFSEKKSVFGRNIGITNEGYLKLLDSFGNELIIYSGDISIRVI